MCTPGWAEAVEEHEGAFFNIVATGLTAEDWHTAIAHIASHSKVWTPRVDLGDVEKVISGKAARTPAQSNPIARSSMPGLPTLWCLDDELQMDLDPRRITDDAQVAVLHELMREFGLLLDRDVTMYVEGSRTAVLYRYHRDTDTIRQD